MAVTALNSPVESASPPTTTTESKPTATFADTDDHAPLPYAPATAAAFASTAPVGHRTAPNAAEPVRDGKPPVPSEQQPTPSSTRIAAAGSSPAEDKTPASSPQTDGKTKPTALPPPNRKVNSPMPPTIHIAFVGSTPPQLDGKPPVLSVLLGDLRHVDVLVDTGCECFAAVSEPIAQELADSIIDIPPRRLDQAVSEAQSAITQLATIQLDIGGWRSKLFAYIVPGLSRDVIVGSPWCAWAGAVPDIERGQVLIRRAHNMVVPDVNRHKRHAQVIEAEADTIPEDLGARIDDGSILTTSLAELSRILALTLPEATTSPLDSAAQPPQPPHESETTEDGQPLPPSLAEFKDLFNKEKASALPPHRGRSDHHIRLKRNLDGSTPDLPWGPLYGMSREQLIELRRQLTDLMDKGWIRASSSSAGAPVLLAPKPGGKWRLCVDYRELNARTEQDRYPLPLIKETMRTLSRSKWFSKVDIRAAFHKLRMREGDEHLTAFRTRFGLFEWLVVPFGLSGAPATFQRYINGALQGPLGTFCTAYLDDVLIYTEDSLQDHWDKVKQVLSQLRDAGLHCDLTKCKFATKEVKYLGFVVTAGEAIRPDPEKIQAILQWEAPTTVRGVRRFIGFANFYRDFLEDFSALAEPLHRLTKKNVPFEWGPEQEEAFSRLKDTFISGPVLVLWQFDRDSLLEADCSGKAIGACLSQKVDGVWHPVGYYSTSLSTPERNYTIHDKELLAIVKSLKFWSAELIGVHRPFTILTDHKNLEYFTTIKELSERQHRWAETLSRFNYHLQYRPGKQAARPDALSRREQDSTSTEKVKASLMNPSSIVIAAGRVRPATTAAPEGRHVFVDPHMQALWNEAVQAYPPYLARLTAVLQGDRVFPATAATKCQIGDCSISAHGTLLWRGVLWVPSFEPLTTTIIQKAHESTLAGHPGKNETFRMIRRDYHWDGMSEDVRRFVRNCHCYGAHVSRKKRQGLLQPLPVADRYWSQISMDFMVDLPQADDDSPRYLLVITDRLSKYVQLEAMTTMQAEPCAQRFVDVWWRFRGFPSSIITDRGSDWLGHFWTKLCALTNMQQLLSTSHHPQTDGGTERANQEVQAVLRMMVNFEQTNWPQCLAACQLALNNRTSSVTNMSPNLLLNGYHADLLERVPLPSMSKNTPQGRAVHFLDHLKRGTELAQAAIAWTQQRQQEASDVSRRPAEKFRVGDKVWFSLRNVKTNRPSRKLDWLQAKYTVVSVPTPLTVTLDLPGDLHKTVHVDLLERAADDPLPTQSLDDSRPGPVLELAEEDPTLSEWAVEEILDVKNARGRNKRQALVKWRGWLNPTWHPLEDFLETEALATFEARNGNAQVNNGTVAAVRNRKQRKTISLRLRPENN